jgi:hypothetical protein
VEIRWRVYRTAEVRWFSRGRPPDALFGWFENLRGRPEERTDIYLGLDRIDGLGVKTRDQADSLELKLRELDLGRRDFPGGVAGRLEQWLKWSFPIDKGVGSAVELSLEPEFWLEVAKRRWMATYELRPDGLVSVVDHPVDDGCSVELTELGAGGEEWWTLGFEAFGSDESLFGSLTAAADTFFSQVAPGHELEAESSQGYPAWLQRLRSRGGRQGP